MRKFLRLAIMCQMYFLLAMPAFAQDLPTSAAQWRFAHLAAKTPPVDVYLSTQSAHIFQDIDFGSITTWASLPTDDDYEIIITQAGNTDAILYTFSSLTLTAGEWLTVAITDHHNEIVGHSITEDFTPTADDTSRMTIFSALETDDDEHPTSLTLYDDDESARSADLAPQQAQTLDGIAPNRYTLQISHAKDDAQLALEAFTVKPNHHYFVALIPTPNGLQIIWSATEIQDQTQAIALDAVIRVAHLSSGSPSFDIYINDQLSDFRRLNFPEFSQWVTVSQPEIEVAVMRSGTTEPLIPPITLSLTPGTYNTITIIGTIANETLQIHPLQEDFSILTSGFVRVSVYNAHPGIGPINVQLSDGTEYLNQLGYPGFFGGNNGYNQFVLETGTYDLQFISSETGETVFELPSTNLFASRNYFIAAINATPPFIFTFSDLAETQNLMQREGQTQP